MTKYYLEILETKNEIMTLKIQEETISLKNAQDLKTATTLFPNESVRVHVCKHGDGVNGNNLPCEVV